MELLSWINSPDYSERLEEYVKKCTLDSCMVHYAFFDKVVADYRSTAIENALLLLRNRFREECLRRISDNI